MRGERHSSGRFPRHVTSRFSNIGARHRSLPVELTRFIGRACEIESLREIVRGYRLLTLTGAGGSGKSRLALEVAPELARLCPDGIAWVELAPLTDAAVIPAAVLEALDTSTEGGGPTVEAVARVIGERAIGLVLDNCEHLVDGAASLSDSLLRSCPGLRIIATSREALGVAGERAWLVPPLSVPDPAGEIDSLAGSDSVRLFLDRARDVLPELVPTTRSLRAIAEICARLDGIPLAIELAAARVRHLSPEQIRDRLDDVFAILGGGARTAIPRHRTLRATLDWSFDLLPEEGRVVFRRLALFRGGFILEAAESVCAGDGISSVQVLDLLALLVDRSLVVVRESSGRTRYTLLEPIRQYAAKRLREAGEEERVREAMSRSMLDLVAAVEPAFLTTERRAAFEALEPELDNLREVLQWTRTDNPRRHLRLVGSLWWFWYSSRHWVEARRWIEEALELEEAAEPGRDRAALLFAAGALACLSGRMAEALPWLEEAAELAATGGEGQLESYALNYLGMVHAQALRSAEARACCRRAEAWARAHGDLFGLRLALLLLGVAESAGGDHLRAVELMGEAVSIARRFGQGRELAVALQTLATQYVDMGDMSAAAGAVRESLEALREDPSVLFICRGIEYLALALAERSPEEAVRWIGTAEALRRNLGAGRFGNDVVRMEPLLARLRQRLGEEAYAWGLANGEDLPPEQALEGALRWGSAEGDLLPAGAGVAVALQPPSPVRLELPGSAAVPEADLTIRALGPLEVEVRGRHVEWTYAKPKELLAYLVHHRDGRTRNEVGAAIWPEATPAQLRNSFHVTLHHLRKALGHPDWLVMEEERYRLTPHIVVEYDVARFERSARAGLARGTPREAAVVALGEAVARYRDHFLHGDTAGPWRDDEQDRLRRLYADAGTRLAALLMEAGDCDGAIAAYEAVLAREPLHEEAHRGLIDCWARTGKRARAIQHYERFASVLRAQLDTAPSDQTAELVRAIRAG